MIQNKCKLIGITGGIASGKSTVKKILTDKSYIVIDADIIAREVVEIDKASYYEVKEFFGDDILDNDRNINREKLSEIVFNNPDKRKRLEEILYPYIFKEILEQIKNKCKNNRDIIFIDIPLLFENMELIKDSGIEFDQIWLVYSDRKTQLKRLIDRDNISIDNANLRINSQMDIEEKKKIADVIIENRYTKDFLIEQISKYIFNLEKGQI
ncbi:MAG: dephospho-CoA kinase [Gudongella sp.]|nr:dephospho-CoA kinase [Gudongella sp.]